MIREVGLVSYTKSKTDHPAPPKDLYAPSALVRKARKYCKDTHDEWYILSAKHGLLEPDGPPIDPYDETLTNAIVPTRRAWAEDVVEDLCDKELLNEDVHLAIHAGKAYYGELLPRLDEEPVTISIPTEGLMFGETLSWYNDRL
jgi:hypothetical protein